MQHVHVTVLINKDLPEVFAAASDHRRFLTGDGLVCHLVKWGEPDKNGLGAIRTVRTKKYTFTEEINAFEENVSFDYLITDIKPKINLIHHGGWLEFKQENGKTRVDWHSQFTIQKPIIGNFIGWLAKRKLEEVFLKRLKTLDD